MRIRVLLSMTGYGEAHYQSDALRVSVELRAVNNRYLKVSVRAEEPYHLLEAEFEKLVRRKVRRGTVQLSLRCSRQFALSDFVINTTALRSYTEQVRSVCETLRLSDAHFAALLGQALALPGVAPEPSLDSGTRAEEWPIIEKVVEEAVDRLQVMRQEEGRAMGEEFLQLRNHVAQHLEQIRARTPRVVELYSQRLHDRIKSMLAELHLEIDRSELIKEVAIFAERSDIAEEIVRLASHLDQFREFLQEPESPGRKLDFLTQEMFREANTIASKSGDVEISRHAVEIKGTLEKIRELVQNVE